MGKGSSVEPAGSALHTVGSRVWVWDSGDWLRAEVVAMAGPRLRVRLEGGDERECAAADIPLQNSSASGVEVSRRLAGAHGQVEWGGGLAGGLVHHCLHCLNSYTSKGLGEFPPGTCTPAGGQLAPPHLIASSQSGGSGGERFRLGCARAAA
jgi:hypothetical protein